LVFLLLAPLTRVYLVLSILASYDSSVVALSILYASPSPIRGVTTEL